MATDDQQNILTDPGVLGETHVPRDIPARQDHIAQLTQALLLAGSRQKPMHCWITGSPGAGKTAAARWLLRKLDMEAGVKGLYVNCWEYPTYFSVLDRIVRELRVLGVERLTVSFKLERLQRNLGSDPFVLVLDEIDQPTPKERHSILYNLSQITNVGLVCVCNSEHVYFALEGRIKSRLNALRVTFPEYSLDDLVTILTERALHALTPDSWCEASLQKIAELAEGDAPVAIQTLRNAAILAEKEGAERVRDADIRKGWNSAKEIKRTYLLHKLTDHHRLLYQLIAKRPGILSGDLWRLYLKTCRSKKLKPIAVRTFSDYCNKIAELGLVQAKRAAIQGKVREFRVPE